MEDLAWGWGWERRSDALWKMTNQRCPWKDLKQGSALCQGDLKDVSFSGKGDAIHPSIHPSTYSSFPTSILSLPTQTMNYIVLAPGKQAEFSNPHRNDSVAWPVEVASSNSLIEMQEWDGVGTNACLYLGRSLWSSQGPDAYSQAWSCSASKLIYIPAPHQLLAKKHTNI